MIRVHAILLLATAAPLSYATNSSSLNECAANDYGQVAGSIMESLRLRGGADTAEINKGPVVLAVGDSHAEFSGTSLGVFCKGCTIINKGIGGTMTPDWTLAKMMEVAESLPEGLMPTHIWLSIGGNDYMERHHCQSDMVPTLQAEITEVLSTLRSVVPPEVKIIMTGYAQVTGEICDYPGFPPKGPGGIVELNGLIAAAAASVGATFVNAAEAVGGGSPTSFTPMELGTHQDLIHLSNKGYCRLFTFAETQAFFGCGDGEAIDCDSVPFEVPGVGAAFYGKQGEDHRLGGGDDGGAGKGRCSQM